MVWGILSPEVVLGYTSFANTSINARKIVGHMIKTSLTSRGVSKNQNPRESPKSSKNLAKSKKSDTNCKLVFILRKNTTIVVIFSEVNTFRRQPSLGSKIKRLSRPIIFVFVVFFCSTENSEINKNYKNFWFQMFFHLFAFVFWICLKYSFINIESPNRLLIDSSVRGKT